jgi:isopenicillin N synthase-like dioxygenase/glycosyltransferase involved in cell wall biosynthesis
MRVFVLTSRIPWPLEKGDKLRMYRQLAVLHAAGHEVHLACLTDRPLPETARAALSTVCAGIHEVRLQAWRRWLRMAWSPFSSRPFQVHWFYQRAAHATVLRIVDAIRPDGAYLQLVRTAEYLKDVHALPRVVDLMDALGAGMRRREHRAPWWQRPLFRLEADRLMRYEASVIDHFDALTIISEADRDRLVHPDRSRVLVVPNGVDAAAFAGGPPHADRPSVLLFTGHMGYPPNVDAAHVLVREVLPLCPGMQVVLAGARPAPAVQALAGARVEVTGWLDDMRDAYGRAALFVAPLRLGSGMQNKLLEAWAAGLAAVTTPHVAAGLPQALRLRGLREGWLVTADGAEDTAAAVQRLLADRTALAETGQRAALAVRELAGWESATAHLIGLLERTFAPMAQETPAFDLVAGIPTLDLRAFTEGSAEQRAEFVATLGRAYETIGFAAISGHGIPADRIDALYAESRRFFELPFEVKQQYARPEAHHQRGFVRQGVEHAKDSAAADLKEFWQVGQPDPPAGSSAADFPDNRAVAELPEFQATAVDAYRRLEALGQTMLRAIALHLDLPEHYFAPWVDGGNSILRLIHYPPILAEPQSAVRSGQHEDINLITLLVGASASGLEVLRHDGAWVPVTALPEHIVVNVGDMLQRLTNHTLASTTHRVVNPPREQWASPRYSMPFFCHPRPDMPLDALPHLVPAGEQPKEAPITAGDYLDQRLREIGLAGA